MAYLIVANRERETDRIELKPGQPITVGRANECDLQVRDVLLSRQHCRIEPLGDKWVVVDLNSRNGTFQGTEKITKHLLSDGDVITFGRSKMCYSDGPFVPAAKKKSSRSARPLDPIEALAGTVIGFQLGALDEAEESRVADFPRPRPQPAEPASYTQGNTRSLVNSLAIKSYHKEFDGSSLNRARTQPGQYATPKPSIDDVVASAELESRRLTKQRNMARAALVATLVALVACLAILFHAR